MTRNELIDKVDELAIAAGTDKAFPYAANVLRVLGRALHSWSDDGLATAVEEWEHVTWDDYYTEEELGVG